MDFFKRIVSLPEKFFFEISIDSIQITLPFDCFLQITVKRNQKKKEKTSKYPYIASSRSLELDSRLTFPVTLYKSSSGYNEKLYFFRLLQITAKRTLKNGKASFNISNLLKSSPSSLSLPLKNCSDPKASLNLTLSLSRIIKTESLNFGFIKENPEYRESRSFDHSPQLSEEKKMKNREKFLRRIEKVNDFRNSPMSAVVLQESDVSSCGSPGSPVRFLESPEKNNVNLAGFSINPIKIDFDERGNGFSSPENKEKWENFIDSEKNSPVKRNSRNLQEISEESFEIDKKDEFCLGGLEKIQVFETPEKKGMEKDFEDEKDLRKIEEEEKFKLVEEQDSEIDENTGNNKKITESQEESSDKNLMEELPKNSYLDTQPNCNSKKELNNVEISSNENQEKCCKCFIV